MTRLKSRESGLCLQDLSPERFEIVINSIEDEVFTVDRDFRINCCNRAAAQIKDFVMELESKPGGPLQPRHPGPKRRRD